MVVPLMATEAPRSELDGPTVSLACVQLEAPRGIGSPVVARVAATARDRADETGPGPAAWAAGVATISNEVPIAAVTAVSPAISRRLRNACSK